MRRVQSAARTPRRMVHPGPRPARAAGAHPTSAPNTHTRARAHAGVCAETFNLHAAPCALDTRRTRGKTLGAGVTRLCGRTDGRSHVPETARTNTLLSRVNYCFEHFACATFCIRHSRNVSRRRQKQSATTGGDPRLSPNLNVGGSTRIYRRIIYTCIRRDPVFRVGRLQ